MALTSKQRNKLPDSAFALKGSRRYPVPTKAQARKAGISERQRVGLLRNALGRAGQSKTAGSYPTIARKVRARAGGKVAAVDPRQGGTTAHAGQRRSGRRGR
jgi:hypothetical protein